MLHTDLGVQFGFLRSFAALHDQVPYPCQTSAALQVPEQEAMDT